MLELILSIVAPLATEIKDVVNECERIICIINIESMGSVNLTKRLPVPHKNPFCLSLITAHRPISPLRAKTTSFSCNR